MSLWLLVLVILIALVFEYINGFHDAANAIATVVSTKVLTPRNALLFGGIFNFIGAFAGTHVAKTIGSGLVNAGDVTQVVILAALLGAIIWNLFTWYIGIPSSSSHALIGGLIGAAVAKSGMSTVHVSQVLSKVIYPMIFSPIAGIVIGFLFMLLLLWLLRNRRPGTVNSFSRRLQLVSSGIMAFSHGSNDAQKTMGIITLAILTYHGTSSAELVVSTWVIFVCALCMCLGTLAGGWRIIRTMGSRVIKLKPIHGFAAETSAASIILTSSFFGIPVSTTHVISTSIMGVGCTQRMSAVKWGLVGTIIQAWIFTLPVCVVLSWLIFHGISFCGFF